MNTEAQHATIWILGLALLVTITIILVLFYWVKKLRHDLKKSELRSKRQEIILNSRIGIQEDALISVSKEIHGNIGQLLSSVKLILGTALRSKPISEEMIGTAEQTVGHSIQELRGLNKELHIIKFENFNLFENLDLLVRRILKNKTGEIKVEADQDANISKEQQLIVFRIIQEALQNSINYGNATILSIQVNGLTEKIVVRIEYLIRELDTKNHSLYNQYIRDIKERIELFEGYFEISSSESISVIKFNIPFHEN